MVDDLFTPFMQRLCQLELLIQEALLGRANHLHRVVRLNE